MMISVKDIDQEIHEKVLWFDQHNGHVIQKDWLVQAMLNDHKAIRGADSDIATCCMHYAFDARVRVYFNKHKASGTTDPQFVLPGFRYLQRRYSVERNAERVLVRVEDASADELEEKIEEYEGMGRACYAHADEIRRFLQARTGNAPTNAPIVTP